MTSACGAGSTACVTEAAMAPTQVEKKKNQNVVGYRAEMKYIYEKKKGSLEHSERTAETAMEGGVEVDRETVNQR